MFDPFNIQDNQKGCPCTSDYLNGKYQGGTGQDHRWSGTGMLLDHNYLLSLAAWEQGQVKGPSFLVFPDCSLFWGHLSQGLTSGVSAFCNPAGYLLFCRLQAGQHTSLVFVDPDSKSMQPVHVEATTMAKAAEKGAPTEYLTKVYLSEGKGIQVQKEQSFTDAKDMRRKLSSLLKTEVAEEDTDFRQFIRMHFGEEKSEQRLEIVDSKTEFTFKFRSSSIICKMDGHGSCPRVRQISYLNEVTRKVEICKKDLGRGMLQESIGGETLSYSIDSRPSECLSALHLYYKQSLNFRNQCFSIDYLYRLRFMFYSIETLRGQMLIKMQDPSSEVITSVLAEEKGQPGKNKSLEGKRFTLAEVREDIYDAVRLKSESRVGRMKTSSFAYGGSAQSRKRYLPGYSSIYHEILRGSANSSFYYPQPFVLPQKQSPGKQRKTEAKLSSSVKTEVKLSSSGKQPARATAERVRGKKEPLSKFAYLSSSREINQSRRENISALTEYYEAIERDLKREGAAGKSRLMTSYQKPYVYDRSTGQFSETVSAGPRKTLQFGWK